MKNLKKLSKSILAIAALLFCGSVIAQSDGSETVGSGGLQTDKKIVECLYRDGWGWGIGTKCLPGGNNCSWDPGCGK